MVIKDSKDRFKSLLNDMYFEEEIEKEIKSVILYVGFMDRDRYIELIYDDDTSDKFVEEVTRNHINNVMCDIIDDSGEKFDGESERGDHGETIYYIEPKTIDSVYGACAIEEMVLY